MTGLDRAGAARLIESIGPWPFITRHTFLRADGIRVILHSRHQRKGLPTPGSQRAPLTGIGGWVRCLWMPGELNWWIGTVFALGSLLFALASVFSLSPDLARRYSLDAWAVNAIYFGGSIPFTLAAYLLSAAFRKSVNAGDLKAVDFLRRSSSTAFI